MEFNKYVFLGRKRLVSLDGFYNVNDGVNVSDDLYDNLCSVLDNENDFNDWMGFLIRLEEGGMIRLELRVQIMFVVLEEVRVIVRQ